MTADDRTHDLHALTRQRLSAGTWLDALRAAPPAGMKIRSDDELDASLSDALRHHDPAADVHVFGYGSLMWNPAMEHTQVHKARVRGWHRRFCLRLFIGRGSPKQPGVMMALDRGGACHGLLFRIPARHARDELHLLWRREMAFGGYDARWVAASVDGRVVRALTFVANRRQGRYAAFAADEVAHFIRTGAGSLGTCRGYFEATLRKLDSLGIRDAGIERVRLALLRADARDAVASPVSSA